MSVTGKKVFWTVLLLVASTASNASTVSLVPTSPTQGLAGDSVSFEIVLDFSDVVNGTIGGGFDIAFDSSSLNFVSAIDYVCISFSCGPDELDGLLLSWAVGDFDGIAATGPVVIGAVEFEILSSLPLGSGTLVTISGTEGLAGPWISGEDFTTILDPTYNQIEVTRVPLPAAVWLLLSGLGVLRLFNAPGKKDATHSWMSACPTPGQVYEI